MPRFTLIHRGRVERSLAVDKDEILVGRMPGIDILLDTPTVSRKHARIRRDGEGWCVEDAGSVNGIHVGDRRVECHPLAEGANVRIEDYVIVFEPPAEMYAEGLSGGTEPTQPRLNFTMVSGGQFAAKSPDADPPTES